jgi:acetoacetate decarboxylase
MVPDPRDPSIPTIAPFYPRPPFRYRDCPVLVITFRTEAHSLRRLVPEPLAPNADDLMVLVIGRLYNDRLGGYTQAMLAAPCSLSERTGNYAVALYQNRPSTIVAGREIYGWPKKDAVCAFQESRHRASASIERNGVEIIRASVDLVGPASPADLALDPTWFNLKLIPSVTDGAEPDVMQLTETTFAGVGAREAYAGPGRVGFSSTVEDPLADHVPVLEIVTSVFVRLDFDLLDGIVVHDYLTGRTREPRVAVGAPA